MRSSLAVLGILLVALIAGCKSESKVDESTVAAETVATFAPATTEGTIEPIPETQTTATVVTQTTATTATVTTQPPVKAAPQTKPVTQPAAKPTTAPPATTTTQAPPAAEPAKPPATAPATATTAPATAPAAAPATKTTTRTPSTKVPKTHTVNREGALHPANTENPTQRCGACHGKDLKGGKVAPSCYSCHDKAVW